MASLMTKIRLSPRLKTRLVRSPNALFTLLVLLLYDVSFCFALCLLRYKCSNKFVYKVWVIIRYFNGLVNIRNAQYSVSLCDRTSLILTLSVGCRRSVSTHCKLRHTHVSPIHVPPESEDIYHRSKALHTFFHSNRYGLSTTRTANMNLSK